MLLKHALDTLGDGEGGHRAADAGTLEGDVDDALLVVDLCDLDVAAICLQLRADALHHVIKHTPVDDHGCSFLHMPAQQGHSNTNHTEAYHETSA